MSGWLWSSSRSGLLRVAAVLLSITVLTYLFRTTWLSHQTFAGSRSPFHGTNEHISTGGVSHCQKLPGADKVLVLLKTGASEIYQKMPIHLLTTLQCIPNYMIFSDLEQSFGDIKVHDAIAPVSQNTRDRVKDLKLHETLAQWSREGQDMTKLSSGWDLDKFKFLPMFREAFEKAPKETEWFVMIEPDTSLSWLNLLLWLKTMDSTKDYYLGSQNNLGETTFSHGGSGIVLSRGAADKLYAARNNGDLSSEAYDHRWEKATSGICCGDVIVANALADAGVKHIGSWPLTQGESLNTIDWTVKHWCTPAVTWHHVSAEQVDSLWRFQNDWAKKHGWNKPYLFRDLFAHYIQDHISVNRSSWNNLSNDRKYSRDTPDIEGLQQYERDAVNSADACAAACVAFPEDECLQWMWAPGKCHLGKNIRYGTNDEQSAVHWTSGWIQDRVESFKSRLENCQIQWQGAQ